MAYSRRFRFADGKSSLHRVEFAREFETRLAGGVRPDDRRADAAEARTPEPPRAEQARQDEPAETPDRDAQREMPDEGQRNRRAPLL